MSTYQYAEAAETIADFIPKVNPSNTDQVAAINRILQGASAAIDRYCRRPFKYFLPAATDPTVRRVRGNGGTFLRIGRHVPGSVTVQGMTLDTDFYEHPENGWLYAIDPAVAAPFGLAPDDISNASNLSRYFISGALYLVTARWGFAETPSDIVVATKMIAMHVWDRGQGEFGQITPGGFVIEKDIPPTAALFLDNWTRKELELN